MYAMRHINDDQMYDDIDRLGSEEAVMEFYLGTRDDSYNGVKLKTAVEALKQDTDGMELSITHSGVYRAKFTAEIIAKGLGFEGDLFVDDDVYDLIKPSKYLSGEKGNLVIAHQPGVECLTGISASMGDLFKISQNGLVTRLN